MPIFFVDEQHNRPKKRKTKNKTNSNNTHGRLFREKKVF